MAIDMFLRLQDIKGESTSSRGAGAVAQSAPAGSSGKVAVNDITFTKHVDRSSPTLYRLCCEGRFIPTAWLVKMTWDVAKNAAV